MMTRRFVLAAALVCGAPALASAQMWQPTPPPNVSAENEPWYQVAEPIVFLDAAYYRAGAPVHFNQYQMVRAGAYRGFPIYVDSTLDPYNIIYVPMGHGLLQPYERRRTGSLAGTTGNRAPSFPTSRPGEGYTESYPSNLTSAPEGLYSPEPVATTGRSIVEAPVAAAGTIVRPKGINAVWIDYDSKRWYSAGKAIRVDRAFKEIGSYRGFPVYRRTTDADRIYIPTAEGMAAPYSTVPKAKSPHEPNR